MALGSGPRGRPIDYEATLRALRGRSGGSAADEAAGSPPRWWCSARSWARVASAHGVLLALLLVAVVLPLSMEATLSHCAALESRFIANTRPGGAPGGDSAEAARLAPALAGLAWQPAIDGSRARRIMAARDAERPAWIGCLISYWWIAPIPGLGR